MGFFFNFAISKSTTDTMFEMCSPFLCLLRVSAFAMLPLLPKPRHWIFTANEDLLCRDISIYYASSIKTQPLSPLRSTLLANSLVSAMPLQIFQVVFCCRQHGLEKKVKKTNQRKKHFQFTFVKLEMTRKVAYNFF